MARLTDLQVTYEIEPVVKLYCGETACRFNLYEWQHGGMGCCALKVVEIDAGGQCRFWELRPEPNDEKRSTA